MKPIYLSSINTYTPKDTYSVSQVGAILREHGIAFFEAEESRMIGLGFDRIFTEAEHDLPEMIYNACAPVISKVLQDGKTIDRILFIHSLQPEIMLHKPYDKVLQAFQLDATVCHSISQQNCASIHFGMHVAQSLLQADNQMEGILLLTADHCFHPFYVTVLDTIMGDAAGCLYMSREPEAESHEFIDYVSIIDGTDREELAYFIPTYYFSIRQVIRTLLKQNGLGVEQVKCIIGSNVNGKTWAVLADYLQVPPDMFYHTVPETGHLFCTDILYNIQSAVDRGILQHGDYYVTVTIGLGGVFGSSLHRYRCKSGESPRIERRSYT